MPALHRSSHLSTSGSCSTSGRSSEIMGARILWLPGIGRFWWFLVQMWSKLQASWNNLFRQHNQQQGDRLQTAKCCTAQEKIPGGVKSLQDVQLHTGSTSRKLCNSACHGSNGWVNIETSHHELHCFIAKTPNLWIGKWYKCQESNDNKILHTRKH